MGSHIVFMIKDQFSMASDIFWRWTPWAVNRAVFAAGLALSWKCREVVLPVLVLAALWTALVPLPTPASTNTGAADMRHIVLVSHFQEGSFVVNRTLEAVNRAAGRCRHPVRVIHACEEKSNISEGLFETVAMPDVAGYERRIHPANASGENAGLSSNLRYAIAGEILCREQLRAKRSLQGSPDVMVTKLDGNAVVPENYLLDLESAWFLEGMSPEVSFQPFIREHGMQEDGLRHWMLKAFTLGNCITNEFTMRIIHSASPCFHSTYSMPLATIEAAGSWDPMLVQEDQLMAQRAALALPMLGFRRLMLNSTVYNAPPLSFQDFSAQGNRCVSHGWRANDWVTSRAMRLSLPRLFAFLPFKYILATCVSVAGSPVCVYFLSPPQLSQSALLSAIFVYLAFRRLPEDREPKTPTGGALFRLQSLATLALSHTIWASITACGLVLTSLLPPVAGKTHYHTTGTM